MIVFLGIAGSGKTIQSKELAKRLDCPRVSVGELLRKNLSGDELDKVEHGHLIDDQIVKQTIETYLKKHAGKQIIIDGSPRTFEQAKWLVQVNKKYNLGEMVAIHLKASKLVVKDRLLARKRVDDNEPAIHKRFDEYGNQIDDICDYLKASNIKLIDVDAELPIDDVQNQISKSLKP